MSQATEIIIQLAFPLLLVFLGLFIGTYLEKKHYQSIRARETATRQTPVVNLSRVEQDLPILKSYLVSGSVVISVDYFKRLLAALRNIFGGRVAAYESLVDRARREAVLRMKAKCPAADIIINLKIETSTISKQGRGGERSVGCIEAIAYGTAIQYQRP